MAKLGTPLAGRCFLCMSYVDAIRPPTPRLTRLAVIGLALVAGGSFASGFLKEVVGPLTLQPQAQEIASTTPDAQPISLEPIVPPAMQVATAEPAVARPAPKLDVPGPVPVSAPAGPAPEPVTALAVTDATATAPAAPAEPAAQPAPPADTPPT